MAATMRQLYDQSDDKRKSGAVAVGVTPRAIEGNTLVFTTTGGGTYESKVEVLHLGEVLKQIGDLASVRARLGDMPVKVTCSCGDFLYGGFAYMGTQGGWSLLTEGRPPDTKNPQKQGALCKHLCAVAKAYFT